MSHPSRPSPRGPAPRGPLPASVYWRRRIVVLASVATVVLLVVSLSRAVLGGGEDGQGEVALSGARPSTTAAVPATDATDAAEGDAATRAGTQASPQAGTRQGSKKQRKKQKAPALPEPRGTCAEEDVVVKPRVGDAVAGRPVTVTLTLRTVLAEACTWELSRSTFTWKITSGSDEIWTSRECPRAVPSRELVLRRDTTTTTELTWGGRRSDADCSRQADWAMAGWYHATVAPLAGEPKDTQFELRAPAPATVTATPEPEPKKTKKKTKKQRG